MSDELQDRARAVQLAVLDVDGVLTDGALFLGDDGQQYKAFHSRDGHGMRMLLGSGVRIAILTGRVSQVVEHRMRDLGVDLVMQGHRDKLPAFEQLLKQTGVPAAASAYIGDDVLDLPVMRRAGFAVAVQDAHPLCREQAHWVTPSGGGRGAVRDFCEFVLAAQGRLDAALEPYLA
jgi:3-deoxy-D-manno-octulosonate 8-phosphate phosphatase (KDO 8-P phosphatase)